MMRVFSPRHSLRGRFALSFAGAVALTALVLTLSAYFLTAETEERDALRKALDQSRFNLFLAQSVLPATPAPTDFARLLEAFSIRGDFSTLILAGHDTFVSGPQVSPRLVTPELAAKVAEGRLGYQMVSLADLPALAVGGRLATSGVTLYFFYPQEERLAALRRLRDTLVIAGAALVVLGLLGGYFLSRRVLRPVRLASQAAALMAQGRLSVRLPEGPDEFGVMNASFNRMAENLQARIADLEEGRARERRFVADAAHELRTPVAALVGEITLLTARLDAARTAVSPEIARLATLLAGDISRLRRLVEDLLEIGRLDANSVETSLATVDIVEFTNQVLALHGWTSAVTVNPGAADSGRPQLVKADKRLLERILVNLLRNALQHGAPPVTIEISARDALGDSEPTIHLAVTDSGPGIPLEHLPHLFDRFYKGDPSRSTAGGSGLGLAIARAYARLLGGDLEAVAGGGDRDRDHLDHVPEMPAPTPQSAGVASGATFVLTLRQA